MVPVTSFAWVVVVPVKPAARGKSRLAGVLDDDERAGLVRAMALDTIDAARSTAGVRRVVVVTADAPLRRTLTRADGPSSAAPAPVSLVGEPPASDDPLGAALHAGHDEARRLEPEAAVAVLLGDLPALRPDDLAAALGAAAARPTAFVADAAGTGTTLLTALPGAAFDPRFGPGSARAHAAAGHTALAVPAASTLRRDVDVPDDLRAAERAGTGRRTAAWLAGRAALGRRG
jgi:2-phospho-L-lactate guanylyltransferase